MMRVLIQGFVKMTPGDAMPASAAKPAAKAARPSPLSTLGQGAQALVKAIVMQDDPVSVFKTHTRLPQTQDAASLSAGWSNTKRSVEDIKKFAKALPGDATVNDVLVAALCGAVRKHASVKAKAMKQSAAAAGKQLNDLLAVMWVSLQDPKNIYKPPSKQFPLQWGNTNLGALYLALPTEVSAAKPVSGTPAEAAATLSAVQSLTKPLKASPEPLVAWAIMAAAGGLPRTISQVLWPMLAHKSSLSVSNVPGPMAPYSWAGVEIGRMSFFVPPQGTLGVFVTIMTYNGKCTVGISANAKLLSQAEVKLITGAYFDEALDALAAAAKL
jgi:diacylglycerol O-acyltransferase